MTRPFWSCKRRIRASAGRGVPALTPQDVAALYGFGDLHSRGIYGQGQRMGFVEFARPSATDDRLFWTRYSIRPDLNRPAQTVEIDLPRSDPGALGETDLDLQYAGALAPGAELIVYLISDTGDASAFMGRLYDALARAAADGCRVVSVSLGTGDAQAMAAGPIQTPGGVAWSDAAAFARALDDRIAADGLLVCAAAGDSGLYGGLPSGDTAPQAVWPASQGAVVAVGGSQLAAPGDVASGEEAWGGQTRDASAPGYNPANTLPTASGGGGGSAFVPCPPHQSDIGARLRQTPDVAAFAGPLTVVDLGTEVAVWGTSAAAPIMASLCLLCGQAMGRLPTQAELYAAARDVTAGNNMNDTLLAAALTQFAQAGPGYDLCTGAGTVVAGDLLRVMSQG
jgi:kumamolisin